VAGERARAEEPGRARAVYRASDPEQEIDEIVFDPFASPWRPAATIAPAAPATAAPAAAVAPETPKGKPYDFVDHVRRTEHDLLKHALELNAHHQKRTAEFLGMTYHQLRNCLRKHGLIGGAAP
jgi:psp operon transcriptional activator